MNERSLAVLEQYDVEVREVFHGRASYICRTDKGRKLLYPFSGSEEKASLLYKLQLKRKQSGDLFVDLPMPKREGGFVSEDIFGNRFILKDWKECRECDPGSLPELLEAAGALARFHKAFRMPRTEWENETLCLSAGTPGLTMIKHNNEIAKTGRFIRNRNKKSRFEFLFLKVYEAFLEQGRRAEGELHDPALETLREQSEAKGCFQHGDFSHHEVLMEDKRAFIIHPEHFQCGIQIEDLAHIMRKILEKRDWDLLVGEKLLAAYDAERSISGPEQSYLKIRLLYPEKFWKLTDHYYNSNKLWISERLEQKLERLLEQEKKRQEFLEKIL